MLFVLQPLKLRGTIPVVDRSRAEEHHTAKTLREAMGLSDRSPLPGIVRMNHTLVRTTDSYLLTSNDALRQALKKTPALLTKISALYLVKQVQSAAQIHEA